MSEDGQTTTPRTPNSTKSSCWQRTEKYAYRGRRFWSSIILRELLLGFLVGACFRAGVIWAAAAASSRNARTRQPSSSIPAPEEERSSKAYEPQPHLSCDAPSVRQRAHHTLRPGCIRVYRVRPTSVVAHISLPVPPPPPTPRHAKNTTTRRQQQQQRLLKISISPAAATMYAPLFMASRLHSLTTPPPPPPPPPLDGSTNTSSPSSSSSPLYHRLTYHVRNLLPEVDYAIHVTEYHQQQQQYDGPNGKLLRCRALFSTPPENTTATQNLVQNGGFEQRGDPPYLATRFHAADGSGPRAWTPFYNGGVRVACGVISGGSEPHTYLVQPRSGRCCARFGFSDAHQHRQGRAGKYFGAHQAVPIPHGTNTVRIGAWFYTSPNTQSSADGLHNRSPDSLAMAVGWQLDDKTLSDPAIVPLEPSELSPHWHYKCLVVSASDFRTFRMIHVYFHFHDRVDGELFVDDVSVVPLHVDDRDDRNVCYTVITSPAASSQSQNVSAKTAFAFSPGTAPTRHLTSVIRPKAKQLTIAVPMTANRILRLESISKLYGGGPLTAAVLVRSKEEASIFTHIWRRKAWLFNHVDVTLVRVSEEAWERSSIPINALRNVAVGLAVTEFVLMLDVDMTPATSTFACFRDPMGKMLSGLMATDDSGIYTLPVFIGDLHVRPAKLKSELMNQLQNRVATTYCMNSQKSIKVDKWYQASGPFETRFTTDFEPFGICRRSQHPTYDERFVGYGFNKISWAWGAEAEGSRLYVMSDSFVTHLNHMDNEWVANISVPVYIRTWRRYLAFSAEVVSSHGIDLP
jgi:Glycosyl-transferase for dystroglycan